MVVVGNFRNSTDLRKKPRRHFHYSARIHVDKDMPLIVCSITDISESGARIVLQQEQALPDTFLLLLTPSGETRRPCRVIWRDGLTVGVKFPESPPLAP